MESERDHSWIDDRAPDGDKDRDVRGGEADSSHRIGKRDPSRKAVRYDRTVPHEGFRSAACDYGISRTPGREHPAGSGLALGHRFGERRSTAGIEVARYRTRFTCST